MPGHVLSRLRKKPNQSQNSIPKTSIRANAGQIILTALKAYSLVSLTLLASGILRSSLDPVYGHVPGSRHHGILTLVPLLTACSTYSSTPGSSRRWARWLAVVGLAVSTIQLFLFRYSGRLGPSFGPLLTSLVTSFPLVMVSVITVAKRVTDSMDELFPTGSAESAGVSGRTISDAVVTAVCLIAYFGPKIGSILLNEWLRTQVVRSRVGLYFVLVTSYAILFPSGYLFFIVIPILRPNLLSAYVPLPYSDQFLNTTLHKYNYSLIARQESPTGYISVLDNTEDGFRVMRCDHSLLGGHWIPPQGHLPRLHEPIYAVFVMLEAVRLVESHSGQHQTQDAQRSALVIGVGIGTTPSALIAHGIDTTVVEIDPVVHNFAQQYFDLPSNHTSIIQDAVPFVEQNTGGKKYDYIIHDVFTGGVEPIALFTLEFLQGLKNMLKSDGVIAINYAGDLRLRSASMVVRTVLSVFPTCRLFREEEAKQADHSVTDFTNLVMFCRKAAGSFSFRRPGKQDFLGSQARQHHLLPRHEANPRSLVERHGKDVISKQNMGMLEKAQLESALGHWKVMRSVLPDAVWEKW